MINMKKITIIIIGLLILPVIALAATDGVYNITVDNIGFSGGESITDSVYDLFDTIGEPLVGIANSEDYKTQDGFWYIANNTISLGLDSNTKDLGTVVAGTPNTAMTSVTVITDAPGGYDLLISKDHELTHSIDGSTTIPDYTGSIATPTTWSGIGLGFTITSGTDVDVKWGTTPNNNYAGIPNLDTVFHEKSGYTSGDDITVIEYKIDVSGTQRSGEYTNNITYAAISKL